MGDDKETVEPNVIVGTVKKSMARNRFPVVRKKCAPTFDGLGVSPCPLHPAGDGSLAYIKGQHEKLAVNPRSAPG